MATAPLTSTANLDEYATQDFWVYTGREQNDTLAYLQPIFGNGATPAHVNATLNMADAYWSWAKNQVMEHHETMDGAFVSPACTREVLAYDHLTFLFYPTQHSVTGHLPPLTSALVEINFQQPSAGVLVSAVNNDSNIGLRYKVYTDGEAGCQAMPDGPRILPSLPAGAKRYVLVSNVNLSTDFDYVVQVQGG
jgi:hypothetical protein